MRIKLTASFVGALIALATATGARAQVELTKHLVITEKAGFVAGHATTISSANATVYPDPLGRYVLISYKDAAHREDELAVGTGPNAVSSSLVLYDSHTGRTKVLWRADADHPSDITEICWLKGAEAALVLTNEIGDSKTNLLPDGHPAASTLQLVRPASTSFVIREVLRSEGGVFAVDASPIAPIAIVMSGQANLDGGRAVTYSTDYFSVTARGVVGSTIPLEPHSFGPTGWSADGITAYFVRRLPGNIGVAGAPPTKESQQWLSFNTGSQTLAPLEKRPSAPTQPEAADTNPLRLVNGATVAAPPGVGGQPATTKPAQFAPLWLVRADGKHEARLPTATLLAADAQESYLLADDSAVLYVADHTVYAVPLIRQRRPDFDLAYRKILQKQTMQNAKQVGLALIGCALDYDEVYPAAADYMTTIAPYLKNTNVFNDPETESPAFTYLLGGQPLANIAAPATTAMGYLSGPGGRAVVYADGHVKWEDSP